MAVRYLTMYKTHHWSHLNKIQLGNIITESFWKNRINNCEKTLFLIYVSLTVCSKLSAQWRSKQNRKTHKFKPLLHNNELLEIFKNVYIQKSKWLSRLLLLFVFFFLFLFFISWWIKRYFHYYHFHIDCFNRIPELKMIHVIQNEL